MWFTLFMTYYLGIDYAALVVPAIKEFSELNLRVGGSFSSNTTVWMSCLAGNFLQLLPAYYRCS